MAETHAQEMFGPYTTLGTLAETSGNRVRQARRGPDGPLLALKTPLGARADWPNAEQRGVRQLGRHRRRTRVRA
jgi:hypothetical protein